MNTCKDCHQPITLSRHGDYFVHIEAIDTFNCPGTGPEVELDPEPAGEVA